MTSSAIGLGLNIEMTKRLKQGDQEGSYWNIPGKTDDGGLAQDGGSRDNKKSSESVCVCSVAQSGLTLLPPIDCGLPGFSVHEIFQAKILEWVAISYSKGSSQPRKIPTQRLLCLLHWQAEALPLCYLGNL